MKNQNRHGTQAKAARNREALPPGSLAAAGPRTGSNSPGHLRKTSIFAARLVSAGGFLLLSSYYFLQVTAIVGDSIRISGGFGLLEALLLLWAFAPWALIVTGLIDYSRGPNAE